MLDTQIEIQERQNKTSFSTRRWKRKSNQKQNNLHTTERPFTTSLGRTQQILNYRNLELAQSQLTTTFRQQMSSYMKKKIKSLTSKKNEVFVVEEQNMQSTITNPQQTGSWIDNKPRIVQQMNFCGLVQSGIKRKTERVLGEPYFINTKEKLTRLMSLKKDKQKQYLTFQDKVKRVGVAKNKQRKKKQSLFRNPIHVQTLDWDSEWRKDIHKQKNRYRTRLSKKHNKTANYMTVQW